MLVSTKQNQKSGEPSRFEDCKKDKVLSCVAQFRNSNFTKELSELIHSRAATFLNFQFIINGYATINAVVTAWYRMEYIFFTLYPKDANSAAGGVPRWKG